MSTEQLLERLEKRLERIEEYIKATNNTKSRWMNEKEAMAEIGCKISKLSKLRYAGKIDWRYAGEGRGVMILRKSVEQYNNSRSTLTF